MGDERGRADPAPFAARAMHVGIALPNYGPLATPAVIFDLAARAEDAGFDSVWVSDHLLAPSRVASVYPYDRRPNPAPGDVGVLEEMYEPLTTLAVLAGRTRRIRLGVSAYVLPYRNQVVTAKQVATLDALSGGRLLLAIGVGWLREEFEALGVPYEARGARTDEYLAVCRALWSEGEATFTGRFHHLPPVRTGPKPVQRPRLPVWVAGNSPAAIRRAARHGDGWHTIDLEPDEIAGGARRLHALAREAGRDPNALTISLRATVAPGGDPTRALAGDDGKIRDDVERFRTAGLAYLVANMHRTRDREQAARHVDAVARAVGL
jgi:probable F420-dependent oxidoreductase